MTLAGNKSFVTQPFKKKKKKKIIIISKNRCFFSIKFSPYCILNQMGNGYVFPWTSQNIKCLKICSNEKNIEYWFPTSSKSLCSIKFPSYGILHLNRWHMRFLTNSCSMVRFSKTFVSHDKNLTHYFPNVSQHISYF